MMNYNLNAIPPMPKTYQHPWYSALQLLENTTNLRIRIDAEAETGAPESWRNKKAKRLQPCEISKSFVVGAQVFLLTEKQPRTGKTGITETH